MNRRQFVAALPFLQAAAAQSNAPAMDVRDIKNGTPLMKDAAWLCVLTTGRGVEGEPGQHIVATTSCDQGATWSPLIDIEPADGPEASWVMPLITPSGRMYVFYTYNKDNLRRVEGTNSSGMAKRVDTLGYYGSRPNCVTSMVEHA